jgi:2-oxoglutarate ferredoxin oxidoreductase subunit gamma
VVLSDEPVGSPKVEEADVIIAMNKPSMLLFEKAVRPGGALIYNSSLIDGTPTRADIRAVAVPCSEIADQAGDLRAANMAMLGAYAGLTCTFDIDLLMEALHHKMGSGKEKLMEINRRAIQAGMTCASESGMACSLR